MSIDLALDESGEAAAEQQLQRNARKRELIAHYDRLASKRQAWIARSQSFYEDEYRFQRFLIPEGSRVLEIGCGAGHALASLKPSRGVGLDISGEMIARAKALFPDLEFIQGDIENAETVVALHGPFDAIIIADAIGSLEDCQSTLERLHRICTPHTRLIISYFNQLWRPLLRFGEQVGQRMPHPQQSWLSVRDLSSILDMADFEVVRSETRQLVPVRMLGIGTFLNRFVAPLPLIRNLCLRNYVVARSRRMEHTAPRSASVLVPCRNERDNIERAVQRLPKFCDDLEILFVEGHSADGTLEECHRVKAKYADRDIKVLVQQGKGKGNAVREGFAAARGDVLIILDADLTVAPEDIGKFFAIFASGRGEFVNGTRLVYPMAQGAMRFLNYLANRTFAVLFSWILSQRFTDTLCGTKAISRYDYNRLEAGRSYFG
ncbi:MAG: glycosyltransferase, partial [Pseudolabrys sp.]|nr:glycosyltransferase [Pseudolabrys sp.]